MASIIPTGCEQAIAPACCGQAAAPAAACGQAAAPAAAPEGEVQAFACGIRVGSSLPNATVHSDMCVLALLPPSWPMHAISVN